MTTDRLFQGKDFNSIHKDIYFFSFKVQLTHNIKNIENFHSHETDRNVHGRLGTQPLAGLSPPTTTAFVLVVMDWLHKNIFCVPFSSVTKIKTPLWQLLI